MSVHQTSVYFGVIVSGALAGYIGETYGWRMSFLSFGGIGILFALLLAVLLREPARGAADLADAADEETPTPPPRCASTVEGARRGVFPQPTAVR